MNSKDPSIWRSEDEFKDTEIGRIPKEWGCADGNGSSWIRLRGTLIWRMQRISADLYYNDVRRANGSTDAAMAWAELEKLAQAGRENLVGKPPVGMARQQGQRVERMSNEWRGG